MVVSSWLVVLQLSAPWLVAKRKESHVLGEPRLQTLHRKMTAWRKAYGEKEGMMNGLHLFVDNISLGIRGLSAHQGPVQGLVNHPGVREKENAFSQYDNRHCTECLRAVSPLPAPLLPGLVGTSPWSPGQCLPLCLLLHASPWVAPLPLAENMTAVPLATTCPGGCPDPSVPLGYCSSAVLSGPFAGSSPGSPLAWSFLHVGRRALGNPGSQQRLCVSEGINRHGRY